MKRPVEEVELEGLERLLGERITVFAANYIYTGKLSGVNKDFILLTDPAIVYETGPFTEKAWKDVQALPHDWYVMVNSIESFGTLK